MRDKQVCTLKSYILPISGVSVIPCSSVIQANTKSDLKSTLLKNSQNDTIRHFDKKKNSVSSFTIQSFDSHLGRACKEDPNKLHMYPVY